MELTIREILVLAIFFFGSMGVFLVSAVLLVRALMRRIRRQPPPRKFRRARIAVHAVAALGVLCVAWGFVEPYRPQVRRVELGSPKVQGAPIRIVLLSDFHSESWPRLEERIPKIVESLSPQVIVVAGDALNSREGLPVFQKCMKRLAEIAPVYAVRGNWDMNYWRDEDLFDGTGVKEMSGESATLEIGGNRLFIVGAPLWESYWATQLIGDAPADAYTLFLYHTPDGIAKASEAGYDLCVAGHTHGGQIALPFYGALVTLSRYGKKYEAGLYRVDKTWLYVNRGIGMEGGMLPVRFCARPEITLIEIAPE